MFQRSDRWVEAGNSAAARCVAVRCTSALFTALIAVGAGAQVEIGTYYSRKGDIPAARKPLGMAGSVPKRAQATGENGHFLPGGV